MEQHKEVWALGAAYEPYVGRWSRLVAPQFISWLAVAPAARWLDVGCGTGALSGAILQQAAPAALVSLDRAPGFLAYARANLSDPHIAFTVGDGQTLPLATASCDVIVSGLVLNFLPDPAAALADWTRVARPGATVAAYLWDYAGEMQMMRYFWDAAAAVDPANAALDEGARFPFARPEPLAAMFSSVGLVDVSTSAIDIPTIFRDFDDYWTPFLGGQGAAPAYAMKLREDQRAALREHLRAALPTAPDGHINLIARAWAVKGHRPT